MKSVYIIVLFFLFPFSLFANHIAGGELTVEWVSGNTYQITLTLYRDCSDPTAAKFDDPGYVTAFSGSNNSKYASIDLGSPFIDTFRTNTNNLCLVAPPNLCIEKGVYSATYTFPPRAGGYIIAYETCCRNHAIINIPVLGQGQGATFTQNIPDSSLAQNHSSPYFNNTPPIVICADNPFSFDYSATSPDGDSLAYSLYNPFTARLGSISNPPFQPVVFSAGYSWNLPMGAASPISIDSVTGKLSFFPANLGWYVVGVCVREYRNGKLLDTHYRDVEFAVVLCNKSIIAQFNTAFNSFNTCVGSVVSFVNQSTNANNYIWRFGDGTSTTSTNPTHIYNTPGTYTVTLVAQPGVSCTDSIQQTVTVYPYPAVPTINVNSPICSGNSITLGTDTVKGATYSWSGPDNFTSHQQDTSIANAQLSNSGLYTLRVTVNGCTSSNSGNISVNPTPPAPTLAAGTNVCAGNNINLSAPTVQGATYSWTGPDNFTSVSQNPVIANAQLIDSGLYSCIITLNGCPSPSAGTTIKIIPIAKAKVSSNTPLCTGQTLQFNTDSASAVTGYTWSGPNNWTSALPDPSIANITLADSGIYSLTLNGNNGCSVTYKMRIVIVITPPLPDVLYKSPLCTGDTLSLSVPNTTGGTYYWTGPNNWVSNDSFPVFNNVGLNNSGNYSIYLSYNGCIGPTKDTNIVVTQTPAALTVSTNTPLCAGETLKLSANDIAKGIYQWTGPGNFSSTGWDDSIPNSQVSNSGNYTVNVTVNGCVSPSSTAKVTVFPIPVSTFNATPAFMCGKGEVVAINPGWKTNTSIYNWKYAGGTLKNAGHDSAVINYSGPGNYVVSLQIEDNNCFSVIDTVPVTVAVKPVAAFSSDTSVGCGHVTIQFSNKSANGNTYLWNFGNGDTTSVQNPSESYNSGNYNVELVAYNTDGCSDTLLKTKSVIIYPIPLSTFTVAPAFLCGQGQVTAADGNWISKTAIYNWNYAGAVLNKESNDSALINYSVPGNYIVSLQVEDNNCFSVTDTLPVVVGVKPIAAFTADTTRGCGQVDIQFNNLSVNGNTFLWNFGNGDTSSLQNPSEIYKVGTFNAQLISTNADGCSDTSIKTDYITIYPVPVSTFNATPTFMCGMGQVAAIGTGWQSNGAIYNWNYTGGVSNNAGNDSATINYPSPGNYIISLQIEDNSCFSLIDSVPIVVGEQPVAAFDADTTIGCGQVDIGFNNLSVNGNFFIWNFGNGDSSSVKTPSIVYSPGTYSVELISINSDGCADTVSKNNYINIIPNPVAKFTVIPGPNVQVLLQEASFSFSNQSQDATHYIWYFDKPYSDSSTDVNPQFKYPDSGNFYPMLVAINEYGCSDTMRVGPMLVEEGADYFVPNTFTPNGDGKNDILYLYGYHVVTSSMQIFDRWGAEVFSSPDPLHIGWNGTFKGKQMDPGVYVYTCTILTIYGEVQHISGDVTLIR